MTEGDGAMVSIYKLFIKIKATTIIKYRVSCKRLNKKIITNYDYLFFCKKVNVQSWINSVLKEIL